MSGLFRPAEAIDPRGMQLIDEGGDKMRRRGLAAALVVCVMVLTLAAPAYADDDGSAVRIGVEWVGKYAGTGAPAATWGDLSTTDECVGGLHNIVTDGSTSWGWAFNWGNGDAWELDWKRPAAGGNAARLVDDVDLVAFSGHGSGNNFQFAAEKNDWSAVPSEMDLGLRDCEWLLTYTCNFLKGTPSTYGVAANGAHLICGYCTDMTVTSNGGSKFASYATTPYGVRVAWYKYGLTTQSGGWSNTARTFGAISAKNDYLWGYGSVAADPPSYGSKPEAYAYWDTKLNW